MLDIPFVPWVDMIGYLGGAVTFWAMYCKTIIPLRVGVIVGNLGFLAFGFPGRELPDTGSTCRTLAAEQLAYGADVEFDKGHQTNKR